MLALTMPQFNTTYLPGEMIFSLRFRERSYRENIGKDDLGVGAHRRDGEIYFAYPVLVLAGRQAEG